MSDELFVLGLAATLAALYSWAFRALPAERWQFLASTPKSRAENGNWSGVNFTFYGFFSATAYALAATLFLLLMGSVGVPFTGSVLLLLAVLLICAPASKLIAWVVEGQRYGFTIGGAAFVGLFAAPLTILGFNAWLRPHLGYVVPLGAGLAATALVYVLGEGVGRLACISFGCCYGRPVDEVRGWLRRFAERFYFVFSGKTKKAAFASGLDGVKLVPVQAMTASLYGLTALVGIYLFLNRQFVWTIPFTLVIAQTWRTYSETFRCDFRGGRTVSPYQIMAALGCLIVLAAPFLLPPEPQIVPDLAAGFAAIWRPDAILFLQAVWVTLFLYMGRSMQTGAELRYHVRADRI